MGKSLRMISHCEKGNLLSRLPFIIKSPADVVCIVYFTLTVK